MLYFDLLLCMVFVLSCMIYDGMHVPPCACEGQRTACQSSLHMCSVAQTQALVARAFIHWVLLFSICHAELPGIPVRPTFCWREMEEGWILRRGKVGGLGRSREGVKQDILKEKLFLYSFSVCLCVYTCTCSFMYTCMCVCEGQRSMWGAFLRHAPT